MNLISLTVAFIGMKGTLILNNKMILIHSISTLGCIGTFCFYTLIEAFFIRHELVIIYFL